MAHRVTRTTLLASTSTFGAVKVTAQPVYVFGGFAAPKNVAGQHVYLTAGFDAPVSVTTHAIYCVQSPHQIIRFNKLESGEIFGITDVSFVLASFPTPEHNPYRPRIPEQLIDQGQDFYDFFEENQQILREQHNITQAGDTTFPYQLTIKSHDQQLYKLGAISRFYHEEFGVFQARYCQFDLMQDVETAHCPVGLFKKETNLEWVVTNRFDLSDPNLVVGISAPAELPSDKSFGWVIVDGPILQQVKNNSTSAAIGESLVWDATGSVNNSAEGKIIGRRVNKLINSDKTLLAGQLWVRVESLSEASIRATMDATIQTIQSAITALQDSVSDLPASAELAAINQSLTTIQTGLNLEIAARKAADVAIQQSLANIDAVTQTTLDNAIAGVNASLSNEVATLTSLINAINATAQQALAASQEALSGLNPLQVQINQMLARFTLLDSKPKNKFPIVDGTIPPNLMYLDDGSLVYTETF